MFVQLEHAKSTQYESVDELRTKHGVVVDERVHSPRAIGECCRDLAGHDCLAGIRDNSAFDEIDHAVADQLGVNAEMFVIAKCDQREIGNCADS